MWKAWKRPRLSHSSHINCYGDGDLSTTINNYLLSFLSDKLLTSQETQGKTRQMSNSKRQEKKKKEEVLG